MAGTPLSDMALKLIAEAEGDRRLHEPWHRDVYRYCMPWRRRPQAWQQVNDQDELFDSTAIGALSDFAADMQTTFTPIEDDWLDVEPAESLDPTQKAQIAGLLKAYKDSIFAEIRRSNFHEASQEVYPDFAAGTGAMCIADYDVNQPIHCQAIPITDLLIVRGTFGGVDFRCRVIRRTRIGSLKATYPKAKIPQSILQRIDVNPGDEVTVNECCWRLWDVPRTERWQYLLLINQEEAESDLFVGPGSCPILVARWRTDSTTAWGFGPLYVVLPTIKTADQLAYLLLKHLNLAVDPVGTFDDDGIINMDNGLTPGTWIPRAAGSKIEVIESASNFDTGFFERGQMQSDIRRALFQDKPDQLGKTPPTASQWMDQKAQIAQRMGAPVGRLVTEWQWAIFQRFAYLLTKRGALPKVELNGNAIRLRPQSPLIRAQRQQGVLTGDRLLEIMQTRFGPNIVPIIVDALKTAENFRDRLGADAVVLRNAGDVQQMIASTLQGQGAGTPPSGAAGA